MPQLDAVAAERPLLFVVPGLTSTSQSGYIVSTVHQFGEVNGYDVVVINYRGLAGAELETPLLYNAYAWKDVLEPMTHVYNKYCKNKDRKVFAVGSSMGAQILTNLIGHAGEECFLDAAFITHAP